MEAASLANVKVPEEGIVYIAVKGSLHAKHCCAFGLSEVEVKALNKKFGDSDTVVNGVLLHTPIVSAINTLCQLGYHVVCSSGEAEITWTLQRDL